MTGLASIKWIVFLKAKWGVDISYIWTREDRLHLAIVIDLFARRVVGLAAGDRLHRDLALTALRKALITRCPPESLINLSVKPLAVLMPVIRRHGNSRGVHSNPFARANHSISKITASTARLSPAAALSDLTTPDFSARRIFSIFIASTTASG